MQKNQFSTNVNWFKTTTKISARFLSTWITVHRAYICFVGLNNEEKNNERKILRQPGVEPGAKAWEASIGSAPGF